MDEQKKEIMRFVAEQKQTGQTITAILTELGIKRSTYYSWLRPADKKKIRSRMLLTPDEMTAIEKTKEEYPLMRHRQIQGILQNKGIYSFIQLSVPSYEIAQYGRTLRETAIPFKRTSI